MMSPAVVATWIVAGPKEGPKSLELLVLWRGSVSWFEQGADSQFNASGGPESVTFSLRYGQLSLGLTFDRRLRSALIDGQRVVLGDDNVLLLDNVDAANVKVYSTMRVNPQMPEDERVDMLVRRIPGVFPFMRCDVKFPDPQKQAAMDLLCRQIAPAGRGVSR
ncbi:MAG: hypothetical protein NUW22_02815 [Acidobacteria bacterium]|nr:hypothetical protein [Acidobacteriota bacterium]